jgi:hypothetical protein
MAFQQSLQQPCLTATSGRSAEVLRCEQNDGLDMVMTLNTPQLERPNRLGIAYSLHRFVEIGDGRFRSNEGWTFFLVENLR